jgi:carbamoyl-phosphate synthase small subunit
MIGYLEIITDPSNVGQILVMTYPQIGNYGVAHIDMESPAAAISALVVRDICPTPSNYRSELSLPEFLLEQEVVAISGVDTRALTALIREKGAMRAIVSTLEDDAGRLLERLQRGAASAGASANAAEAAQVTAAEATPDEAGSMPDISAVATMDNNLVAEVSTAAPYTYEIDLEYSKWMAPIAEPRFRVVVYDCGVNRTTLRNLVRVGCAVTVVPWNTPSFEVLVMSPDGVLFSSGPGDPRFAKETIQAAQELLGKIPVFGIGLGLQILALAAKAKVGRLSHAHRGANQPVKNLLTDTVQITSQNHAFAFDFDSLGTKVPELSPPVVQSDIYGRIQLVEVSLNDGSAEGLSFMDIPAFGIQYHPAVPPGPAALPGEGGIPSPFLESSPYSAFVRLMEGRSDYLNPSADRLTTPSANSSAASAGTTGGVPAGSEESEVDHA